MASARQQSAWDEDGWVVLTGLLPSADVEPAMAAVRRLFPSADEMASGEDEDRTAPWRDWDAAWPEFPFHSRSLNRLALHDTLIDLASQLLGTDDLRLYLALVTAKYGGQSSGYNRLLHTDYPNHSLVVPSSDPAFGHLEAFVYLSDVTVANGATRMVSRRRTAGIPVERHTLSLEEYAPLYDEEGDASGPAGTVVAYRPDTYHRSVDVDDPGASRFLLHLAWRPGGADWGGYQAWPIKGYSAEWHDVVRWASPRQLALFGFPPPGHPYWTAETVAGVAARYPGLDTGPWAAAL